MPPTQPPEAKATTPLPRHRRFLPLPVRWRLCWSLWLPAVKGQASASRALRTSAVQLNCRAGMSPHPCCPPPHRHPADQGHCHCTAAPARGASLPSSTLDRGTSGTSTTQPPTPPQEHCRGRRVRPASAVAREEPRRTGLSSPQQGLPQGQEAPAAPTHQLLGDGGASGGCQRDRAHPTAAPQTCRDAAGMPWRDWDLHASPAQPSREGLLAGFLPPPAPDAILIPSSQEAARK